LRSDGRSRSTPGPKLSAGQHGEDPRDYQWDGIHGSFERQPDGEGFPFASAADYLPRKLATANSPAGSKPTVGDIAYYAPWGNLAIFYRDAAYARGLVPLGRLESGIEALKAPGPLKATIERAP
jgi:hypothetical protein